MKTTIDLADDLALKLKKRAESSGTSMRKVIHEALRHWLKNQPRVPPRKRIETGVGLMNGKGLTAEAASLSWEQLRELSYGIQKGAGR